LSASFLPNQDRVNEYCRDLDERNAPVREIQRHRRGKYDALVLLSGGKDSTYALARLVDMGLQVYAFSLDNGFISDQAKENIDKVCERLGVDHHYATTPHMNDIFVDSLTRYSNVCHGCFKTIYNLSLQFAETHDIDYIFTGLSRGQLFETRLNNELFSDRSLPLSRIDDMVQAARVQYHAVTDAPNRLLNIEKVNCGLLPEKIAIVDFYRYCHVELADMIHYLSTRVGWVRPADTGRSTNCLINDVGIHVHKLEQGFHNYSLPYSWDVRLGHKRRDEALEELADDIDTVRVNEILQTIGYTPELPGSEPDALCVYIKGSESLSVSELHEWMHVELPAYMRPSAISLVEHLPLNANGKIDRNSLVLARTSAVSAKAGEALDPEEARIAVVWQQFISTEITSPMDDFFRLGGDSLSAIRCVVSLRELGYDVEPAVLFRTPCLRDFARLINKQPATEPAGSSNGAGSFSALDATQREKLQRLLARKARPSGG
ncbi:MAG: phosphopantetheine-binding protein, partial [Granulosicoccus sp.]